MTLCRSFLVFSKIYNIATNETLFLKINRFKVFGTVKVGAGGGNRFPCDILAVVAATYTIINIYKKGLSRKRTV